MQPIIRPTVRVLLIDESDRILMFRHEGTFHTGDIVGNSLWAPPGGGVEPGEDYEDAARRELWAETGLSDIDLEPCVWLRDHVFDWNGNFYEARERYLVCHVVSPAIDTSHQSPEELKEMTDIHWWALDEIAAAIDQIFVPRALAELLGPVLQGECILMNLRIET